VCTDRKTELFCKSIAFLVLCIFTTIIECLPQLKFTVIQYACVLCWTPVFELHQVLFGREWSDFSKHVSLHLHRYIDKAFQQLHQHRAIKCNLNTIVFHEEFRANLEAYVTVVNDTTMHAFTKDTPRVGTFSMQQ